MGTAKGERIIYAVSEMRRYLELTLGRPTADTSRPVNDAFAGKKGILAMSVSGWSNATGHIALWDGKAFREPDHDNYAGYNEGTARTTRGEFWELA